jgi:hypothetical protein
MASISGKAISSLSGTAAPAKSAKLKSKSQRPQATTEFLARSSRDLREHS